MKKEQILFELVSNYQENDMDGIGIHDSGYIDNWHDGDCGFRVYHKDGYCFDITKIKDFKNEDDINGYWCYEYHEGQFDGFKELLIENAIDIFKKLGL